MKLKKFLLGTKEKVDINQIDIRGYASYVLQQGEDLQKRELLGCLKSRIYLASKKISMKQ